MFQPVCPAVLFWNGNGSLHLFGLCMHSVALHSKWMKVMCLVSIVYTSTSLRVDEFLSPRNNWPENLDPSAHRPRPAGNGLARASLPATVFLDSIGIIRWIELTKKRHSANSCPWCELCSIFMECNLQCSFRNIISISLGQTCLYFLYLSLVQVWCLACDRYPCVGSLHIA